MTTDRKPHEIRTLIKVALRAIASAKGLLPLDVAVPLGNAAAELEKAEVAVGEWGYRQANQQR